MQNIEKPINDATQDQCRLDDIEGQTVTITQYDQAEGDYGPYILLHVQTADDANPVTVATGSRPVVDQVTRWFRDLPGVPLKVVPTRRISKKGHMYWTLLDPVQDPSVSSTHA